MKIEEIKEWRKNVGHLKYSREYAIECIDTLLAEVERLLNKSEVQRQRVARLGLKCDSLRGSMLFRKDRAEKAHNKLATTMEALQMIAGERQCLDNLMSNVDIAIAALKEVSNG